MGPSSPTVRRAPARVRLGAQETSNSRSPTQPITPDRPAIQAPCFAARDASLLPSPSPLVAPAAYTIGEMAKLGTEHEGVAHRMVRDLYASAFRANPRSFRVHVQFVQVYVEKVFDLLADAGDGHSKLTLREDKSQTSGTP